MKAAYLMDIQRFELKEVEKPVPLSNEVLVRVKSVGICGSDVHFYEDGRIGPVKATFPYIIGHECSGIVEATGDDVDQKLKGKRVFIEPAIYCYTCKYCKSGQYNICPNVGFLGTPPVYGAYAEYIKMPTANIIPIPDEISYDEAVMLEPITIGFHAINRIGIKKIEKADNIAIFGCGPIGLTILSILRSMTNVPIFALDRLDYRLKIAKELGGTFTYNVDNTKFIDMIRKETLLGVDIAIEAAGDQNAIYKAAEACAPSATLLIAGIPKEDNIIIDAHATRRKELDIKLLRRSNSNTSEALEFLIKNKSVINTIITHKLPLKDIEKGFKLVSKYADNVIKVILNP